MTHGGLRRYLLCALPRTGSWYLAEALESTFVLGYPQEYVRGDYESAFLEQWRARRPPTYADYLRGVLEAGSTPNGVFAMKIHWAQFEHLVSALALLPGHERDRPHELVARHLGDLRYVLLLRRDRLRQAVSYHRAITSNVWWQHDGVPPPAAAYPDVRHILELHALLEAQERAWRRYFRRSGIEPLTLHYEDVVADPAAAVRAIAAHVGVEAGVEPVIHLRRQADSGSDAMVRAVRAALAAGATRGAALELVG